jgi:hypothetical protein
MSNQQPPPPKPAAHTHSLSKTSPVSSQQYTSQVETKAAAEKEGKKT